MCSFVAQIENVLENHTDNCAVAYWDEKHTYKTLFYKDMQQISKNITEAIRNIISDKYVCIGLYMEHNPYVPSLIISLQKCDLVFIFLDPYASNESNLSIIKRLDIKWIISYSQEIYNNNFLSTYSSEIANLGCLNSLKLWKSNVIINSSHALEDICFIISTSGSTGEPKIVKVQHECIASNIHSFRKIFKITENDVIYFGTPLTFDPSMVELFLALSTGSTLLIAPQKIKINPVRLLNILFPKEETNHKSVTVLQIVPSLFLRWSQADIEFIVQKSTCRILAFGGEKFPESILSLQKSKYLRIFNLYGITEVSCWASVFEVTGGVGDIPLGNPLNDTILEVKNDVGAKVIEGEGQLHIGSFCRICYINDESKPDLVKPVFRSTGDIVRVTSEGYFYVCRNNHIIKRLGHRVNLLQIEDHIFKQTAIPNVCIWLEHKTKLGVFITINEHNALTKQKIVDKLRVKLLHSLPKQCFPDHIEIIPNFPLSKHGKIDRKSLEHVYNKLVLDHSTAQKRDPVEVFESLWCKYLGLSISEVGKYHNCNFFEAGGNSIAAIQYLSEFQDLIGADYPSDLTTLFFDKTLKDCNNFLNDAKVVPSKKRRHSMEESGNKLQILDSSVATEYSIKLEVSWKYNLEGCVDSSPTVIEKGDSTMVAVGSFANIFAVLDSETGNVISQIVLPNAIESACAVSPSRSHIFTGCYDGNMYCVEIITGEIIWKYSTCDRIKCTPCLCLENKAIAFGSYDKHIHCVNIQTGERIWKTLVKESVTSNLVAYKEQIYVATTFGTCLCLAERNGIILWKCNIGVPIFGSPCIHNSNIDTVIWPDVNGILHSFSCAAGEKQWTFKANGNVYSSLRRLENFIVFGCDDHNIYCVRIDGNTCSVKYKVLLESAVYSSSQLLQCRDKIYIIAASTKGNLYVIEFSTGKILERLQLPDEIFSSPTIRNNCIYIGCRDNNLYCVSIVNNEVNK